jgi:hypothetical protein
MSIQQRRRRFVASGGVLALTLLALVASAQAALPDNRGWEMVSPAEKNGGQVDPPETIAAGGALQAASQGGTVTYASRASFAGGQGAPPASQYLSARASSSWPTQNLTMPVFSGSYGFTDQGVPYRLFSTDLARGLLLNGERCRGQASECPVANPPLPGTDAPAGFQDYYLREGSSFEALIAATDIAGRGLDPSTFEVRLAGASPDLRTIVLSSCAALTDTSVDGCATGKANLYAWSKATGALGLINTTPGAELAAQGAVSVDGSRIYWKDTGSGNLFLREGATNTQIDTAAGGGGTFQAAAASGSVAYFTKAGHLWRYSAGTATDLTPGGEVAGVLGASGDGTAVYFQDASALKLWKAGVTSTAAAGPAAADPSTYPPATGASRVSEDGTRLLFLSKAKLTGYNNTDKVTSQLDSEVFLYDVSAATLKCLSCRSSGKPPIGPSTIPGAIANGSAPGSIQAYKPRVLSANGRRVFFDTGDALVSSDSNSNPTTGTGVPDVYQWEAQGEGSCTQASGCVSILSNGAQPQGASFADASSDGADVYFLTEVSLVGTDPGSRDLYDARIGGGFPEPGPQIPCDGDACQVLPPVPPDPSLGTLAPGAGNPPVSYRKYCRRGYVKRKGICVKKGERQHRRTHPSRSHKQGGKR